MSGRGKGGKCAAKGKSYEKGRSPGKSSPPDDYFELKNSKVTLGEDSRDEILALIAAFRRGPKAEKPKERDGLEDEGDSGCEEEESPISNRQKRKEQIRLKKNLMKQLLEEDKREAGEDSKGGKATKNSKPDSSHVQVRVSYRDEAEPQMDYGIGIRSRLLAVDLAAKRSAAVDRAVSQAIATSVALRRKSTGIALSTWSPTAAPEAPPGSGSQVLTSLLQDCFSADRGRIALVICLPPTAPDREKVLTVLEALGLRQSWVETAETRAERRFSPPQPLELPGLPKLPPSPVLLQKMASSPVAPASPKNSVPTNDAFGLLSFDSKLSEEDL